MASDSGWWERRLGGQRPQQPAPQYPPTNYQPQPAPQYQQAPNQPAPQPQVTPGNLFEAAQHWQGGEATKTERQNCPKCGSGHFFSRSQGAVRGPAPAPICYHCGYNGMFSQGDPATWQTA